MIAMPSEPPTWRNAFSTAEPTPALSTGTDPIAVAVVGVIASAIPNPPARSPGSTFQKFELWSSCANRSSDSVTRLNPAPISQREPIRSDRRPACGATRMISTVIGRKIAPVCVGL